jgi:hypothetical protein
MGQPHEGNPRQAREERASFLKKRSKKRLLIWVPGVFAITAQYSKSFLRRSPRRGFFSKKRFLLPLALP